MARTVVVVPIRSARSAEVGELKRAAFGRFPRIIVAPSSESGLALARAATAPGGFTLVTGSDYLVGEVIATVEGSGRSARTSPTRCSAAPGRVGNRRRGRRRDERADPLPWEEVLDRLSTHYHTGDWRVPYLREHAENPFQVLIGTILSQRTRDANTDRASAALFAVYPDAPRLAAAPLARLERLIRPVGFYHTKARHIRRCARELLDRFGGEVPRSRELLLTLPGSGRRPPTARSSSASASGDPGGHARAPPRPAPRRRCGPGPRADRGGPDAGAAGSTGSPSTPSWSSTARTCPAQPALPECPLLEICPTGRARRDGTATPPEDASRVPAPEGKSGRPAAARPWTPPSTDLAFFHAGGFRRQSCRSCGSAFWSLGEHDRCQEAPCAPYSFQESPGFSRPRSISEMRETYLSYFEHRGHTRLRRYPVVARWRNDVFFVQASIYDFQPWVTGGLIPPPANPLTISQPCVRFNDLKEVGHSGRRLTEFEMMAHHAFNRPDHPVYFKDRCVELCHELLVGELGADPGRITYKEEEWEGGGNLGPSLSVGLKGMELATLVFMEYTREGDRLVPCRSPWSTPATLSESRCAESLPGRRGSRPARRNSVFWPHAP